MKRCGLLREPRLKRYIKTKEGAPAAALVAQLLKGGAAAKIKEFLRSHPGAEQEVRNAFAARLAKLGREAAAQVAVSVAAVQDLFEMAFNPGTSSAPRRWGEPFFFGLDGHL